MKVSLEQVLENKEQRARRQKEFLSSFAPLICISVNIPGNVKLSKTSIYIYDSILEDLHVRVKKANLTCKSLYEQKNITGCEGIFYTPLDARELKKLTCKIENEHFLGRFIDIDVLDKNGNIISRRQLGYERRKCFLCERDAFLCSRSRSHETSELLNFIKKKVKVYKKVKKIAFLAKKAMLKEVELSPKPGLVDRFDSGSHKDMDINTFYKSIDAIAPFLERFILCGYLSEEKKAFENLRSLGLRCENAMFAATKGVNTHKGLIFSFAVILGSIGQLLKEEKALHVENLQPCIKNFCKDLVKNDFKNLKNPKSAGERYFLKTKNAGIRAEAMSGYESIFSHILPFFLTCKKKYKTNKALKLTLLKTICTIDDTSVFNRGGENGLKYAQKKSKKLLLKNPNKLDKNLKKLNKKFIKKNLSSGGSADMLALTYFLYYTI